MADHRELVQLRDEVASLKQEIIKIQDIDDIELARLSDEIKALRAENASAQASFQAASVDAAARLAEALQQAADAQQAAAAAQQSEAEARQFIVDVTRQAAQAQQALQASADAAQAEALSQLQALQAAVVRLTSELDRERQQAKAAWEAAEQHQLLAQQEAAHELARQVAMTRAEAAVEAARQVEAAKQQTAEEAAMKLAAVKQQMAEEVAQQLAVAKEQLAEDAVRELAAAKQQAADEAALQLAAAKQQATEEAARELAIAKQHAGEEASRQLSAAKQRMADDAARKVAAVKRKAAEEAVQQLERVLKREGNKAAEELEELEQKLHAAQRSEARLAQKVAGLQNEVEGLRAIKAKQERELAALVQRDEKLRARLDKAEAQLRGQRTAATQAGEDTTAAVVAADGQSLLTDIAVAAAADVQELLADVPAAMAADGRALATNVPLDVAVGGPALPTDGVDVMAVPMDGLVSSGRGTALPPAVTDVVMAPAGQDALPLVHRMEDPGSIGSSDSVFSTLGIHATVVAGTGTAGTERTGTEVQLGAGADIQMAADASCMPASVPASGMVQAQAITDATIVADGYADLVLAPMAEQVQQAEKCQPVMEMLKGVGPEAPMQLPAALDEPGMRGAQPLPAPEQQDTPSIQPAPVVIQQDTPATQPGGATGQQPSQPVPSDTSGAGIGVLFQEEQVLLIPSTDALPPVAAQEGVPQAAASGDAAITEAATTIAPPFAVHPMALQAAAPGGTDDPTASTTVAVQEVALQIAVSGDMVEAAIIPAPVAALAADTAMHPPVTAILPDDSAVAAAAAAAAAVQPTSSQPGAEGLQAPVVSATEQDQGLDNKGEPKGRPPSACPALNAMEQFILDTARTLSVGAATARNGSRVLDSSRSPGLSTPKATTDGGVSPAGTSTAPLLTPKGHQAVRAPDFSSRQPVSSPTHGRQAPIQLRTYHASWNPSESPIEGYDADQDGKCRVCGEVHPKRVCWVKQPYRAPHHLQHVYRGKHHELRMRHLKEEILKDTLPGITRAGSVDADNPRDRSPTPHQPARHGSSRHRTRSRSRSAGRRERRSRSRSRSGTRHDRRARSRSRDRPPRVSDAGGSVEALRRKRTAAQAELGDIPFVRTVATVMPPFGAESKVELDTVLHDEDQDGVEGGSPVAAAVKVEPYIPSRPPVGAAALDHRASGPGASNRRPRSHSRHSPDRIRDRTRSRSPRDRGYPADPLHAAPHRVDRPSSRNPPSSREHLTLPARRGWPGGHRDTRDPIADDRQIGNRAVDVRRGSSALVDDRRGAVGLAEDRRGSSGGAFVRLDGRDVEDGRRYGGRPSYGSAGSTYLGAGGLEEEEEEEGRHRRRAGAGDLLEPLDRRMLDRRDMRPLDRRGPHLFVSHEDEEEPGWGPELPRSDSRDGREHSREGLDGGPGGRVRWVESRAGMRTLAPLDNLDWDRRGPGLRGPTPPLEDIDYDRRGGGWRGRGPALDDVEGPLRGPLRGPLMAAPHDRGGLYGLDMRREELRLRAPSSSGRPLTAGEQARLRMLVTAALRHAGDLDLCMLIAIRHLATVGSTHPDGAPRSMPPLHELGANLGNVISHAAGEAYARAGKFRPILAALAQEGLVVVHEQPHNQVMVELDVEGLRHWDVFRRERL